MRERLIMLGTGHAMVTKCYNTCFVLETENSRLLVDAGGGNQILAQLEKVHIDITSIHFMFVTHSHTDHVLGVIWVIRKIATLMKQGKYEGNFTIFCHDECKNTILSLCELTLMKKQLGLIGERIFLDEIIDGDDLELPDMDLCCFDIHSNKKKQFGFQARLLTGKIITCLGDEPYHDCCESYMEDADWLMCESFCMYEDRERFKPYEKFHSTVKDAAEIANQFKIPNLVLYHTEDTNIAERKRLYTDEAKKYYMGNVYVPIDLEEIVL